MDAFFSPFLPPFYSNLAVPSGAQKVSVLILSMLFPLGSHYIHACLCLLQMVQTPRQLKANTWEDADHHCSTQGSACCISNTQSVPWAVPETLPGCSTVILPAFSKWGTSAGSHEEFQAGSRYPVPPQLHCALCLSSRKAARVCSYLTWATSAQPNSPTRHRSGHSISFDSIRYY